MSEPTNPFDLLLTQIRCVIRQEVEKATQQFKLDFELLEPEQLARKLKVPLSWVYEQSRQGNIPTIYVGRYIRFNLAEVLASRQVIDRKEPKDIEPPEMEFATRKKA